MKKTTKKTPAKKKGKLAAQARAKIVAALKSRWAKTKAPAAAKNARPPATDGGELEVMPKEGQELSACVEQIRELQFTINEKTRDLVYDIVATGVYFLKLRDLHLMQGHKGLAETVSASEDAEQGFYNIIEKEFCRHDIKDEDERKKHIAAQQRSARNYMNAARNANLTGDHTLQDVQELRQKGVLDGKKATDLYKLTDKAKAKFEDHEPVPDLAAEALAAFEQAAEQIRILKEHMTNPQWEVAVASAKTHLEALTDSTWDNSGDPLVMGEHEHATVVSTASPARTGGKRQ